MQDKRRCHRLAIELSATFLLSDKPNQVDFATTMDMSATGIRLLTKEKVKKQQKLVITVKLPEEGPIVIHAEVVWVKEVPVYSHTEYQVGIQIDDSMPADEAKFVRYYAHKLKEFFGNNPELGPDLESDITGP